MPLDVAGRLQLLSTFGTQIGEIALIPATGGIFTAELVSSTWIRCLPHHRLTCVPQTYIPPSASDGGGDGKVEAKTVLLWDRKTEGGFPETKVLKQRVRDHIDPKRDLGHSDVGGKKGRTGDEAKAEEKSEEKVVESAEKKASGGVKDEEVCEDCK
ncbi:hypothetical protein SLS60_001267 [Paraconiothyrium brasiliense]|uniref:Uncharacterized protein n=1 Tax=Paraconiothyrium brasiliense TaxID=300254 RepID=A0ABR3S8S5_9PLEO